MTFSLNTEIFNIPGSKKLSLHYKFIQQGVIEDIIDFCFFIPVIIVIIEIFDCSEYY